MNSLGETKIYEMSVYTNLNTLHGEMACPVGLRLSDLFNYSKSDFREFFNVREAGDKTAENYKPKSFVRRDSIQCLGISPADAGRGIGAKSDIKPYPFVSKAKLNVTLQLQNYRLSGWLNLREDQTIDGLLSEDKQFIPLTDVMIETGQGLNDAWPFAMVNKKHLVWLQEGQPGPA
jgi:hypothetical protein